MLSIIAYGVLLVEFVTLNDGETTKMVLNILNHIINGLFTFAAVLNLPVRIVRLKCLFMKRSIPFVRQISAVGNFLQLEKTSTNEEEAGSQLIFDHLSWGTQHIILQALLWNSLFQIINQVFRCVYYSYEMTVNLPGRILVNTFFPLAILASVIAALIQAVAESRFLKENSLRKKQSGCKKQLVEFWRCLWKVQTEGKMVLARQFNKRVPDGIRNIINNLSPRLVGDFGSWSESLEELQEALKESDSEVFAMSNELYPNQKQQFYAEPDLDVNVLSLGDGLQNQSRTFDMYKEYPLEQSDEDLGGHMNPEHDATEGMIIISLTSPIAPYSVV